MFCQCHAQIVTCVHTSTTWVGGWEQAQTILTVAYNWYNSESFERRRWNSLKSKGCNQCTYLPDISNSVYNIIHHWLKKIFLIFKRRLKKRKERCNSETFNISLKDYQWHESIFICFFSFKLYSTTWYSPTQCVQWRHQIRIETTACFQRNHLGPDKEEYIWWTT